jgi:hypothetical protein
MEGASRKLAKRLRERAGQYDEYDWHSAIELEAAAALEQKEPMRPIKVQLRCLKPNSVCPTYATPGSAA